MLMTTSKLIVLRLFNATFGRFAVMNEGLRWILVRLLIKGRSKRKAYNASSRFFDIRELD